MKNTNYLTGAIVGILLLVMACEKNEKAKPENDQQSGKIALLKSMVPLKTTGPLTYVGTLCPLDDIYSNVDKGTIYDPSKWDYYKFYGIEGQTVNINLVRVDCEMDPTFSLFFGTSATIDGIGYFGSSNPDLEFVTFRDDEMPRPLGCAGTCFSYGDPAPEVVLPSTGWYTLGVYDFISCGTASPLNYHLTISGIPSCIIVIDGCDTGVRNQMVENSMMQTLIDQCAVNAKNHGQYVSRVAKLTEGWQAAGLISMEEKDAIMECAAKSGIPY